MEKSRYWFVTIQVANMMKAGLSDEQINDYAFACEYFLNLWQASSPTRTGCVTACISANGLYHLHAALHGEKTTQNAVASLLFDSHVEACRGGLKKLSEYVLKEGEFKEKGEKVVYEIGRENIKSYQGKRSDLKEIEELIQLGLTPREIMNMKLSYCRYEKEIKRSYLLKKINEAPARKNMYVEWHTGPSGSGKSYTYDSLCQIHGEDDIYFAGYMTAGWLDGYMESGCPPILFMDELKPSGSWQELLNVLDVYSKRTIHSRYMDCYPLWNTVHITSIYPPEEIHLQMVKEENRKKDTLEQLMRRISVITYHFIHNGVYMKYSIPAASYTDYESLKRDAYASVVGGEWG